MRIGILCLQHESNPRVKTLTTLRDFHIDRYLFGDDVWQLRDSFHEVGGFLSELGDESVPLMACVALPGGPLETTTAEVLLQAALDAVTSAKDLDALLVAPHGAAETETDDDFDGTWLTAIRHALNPDVPIVCTLDPHANLSPRIVAATDGIIAYRTNPHLDQRERGVEAARLAKRVASHACRPVMKACFPKISIAMEAQHTDERPLKTILDWFEEVRRRPNVLTADLCFGFPYSQASHRHAAGVVVTENDAPLATSLIGEAHALLIAHRDALAGRHLSIEDAIEMGLSSPKPVCLLDMGDNVGAGAPGDSTAIIHATELVAPNARVFVSLFDPHAVEQFSSLQPGQSMEASVAGRFDTLSGAPLHATFTLRSVHDGRFVEAKPRHGGRTHFNMGRVVILEAGRFVIQVTSERVAPFSAGQLTSCDIIPSDYDFIITKGAHAPVAAYREFCQTMIRVASPGATAD